MILDHIAVLTTEIEAFRSLNQLRSPEPVEVFDDSGSREQYIDGDAVGGRLLLMQAHGPGPYQRALSKRGPGLHHLGVAVSDLAGALPAWRDRGWQVHPRSGDVVAPDAGAFLFQRGVPTLIELFVGLTDLTDLASEVALPADRDRFPDVRGVRLGAAAVQVTHRGRLLEMY